MGLIIYSNDTDGIEVWQSSSSTYTRFLDEVGAMVLKKYNIKPDRYIEMEKEHEENKEALIEYPKMKSIIQKNIRQLLHDMKAPYNGNDIHDGLLKLIDLKLIDRKDIDENIKKAINALYFKEEIKMRRFRKKYGDEDDDDDEDELVEDECTFWTSDECHLIYDMLKDMKIENFPYNIGPLLYGLQHCYKKGVGAYFC